MPNPMSFSWPFTTADTTAPLVTNNLPIGVGQPLNSNIQFDISDPESGINLLTLNVTVNGIYAILNGVFQSGFIGTIINTGGGTCHVIIDPNIDFNILQTVTVGIDASNNAGVIMPTFTWSFETESGEIATNLDTCYTLLRFQQLSSLIPDGSFYSYSGELMPYKSNNTRILIDTEVSLKTFRVLINEVAYGYVTSNFDGILLLNIKLPLGDIVLELQQESSTNKIIKYITTRNFSVWHCAYAEQFTLIDTYNETTLNSFKLEKAGPVDIDLAHGTRLITPNDFSADLESYRDILGFIRQAFRYYNGKLSGNMAAIAAITQVNPLTLYRNLNAPRWILGQNKLPNGNFSSNNKTINISGLNTNINNLGAFVSNVIQSDSYLNEGNGTLTYSNKFKRFRWDAPKENKLGPNGLPNALFCNSSDVIDANGTYNINTGRYAANLISKYTNLLDLDPFNMAQYDNFGMLHLEIDNRGIFSINIEHAFDTQTIIGAINAYLRISNIYGSQRYVTLQPAGGVPPIKDYIEIIAVSDNTRVNAAPGVHSGSGFIQSDGAWGLSYKAPTDASYGAVVVASPGETIRLYADNGIEYIDVSVGYIVPPAIVGSFFTIEHRYHNIASLYNNSIKLDSKNVQINDGTSSIRLLEGPYSKYNMFGHEDGTGDLQGDILLSISAGDTQIRATADTMKKFNSDNSENVNLPFDIIVGRGTGPKLGTTIGGTSFSVNHRIDYQTYGLIYNIVGLTVKKGFTHIRFYDINPIHRASVLYGVHPIIDISETLNRIYFQFNGSRIQRNYYNSVTLETNTYIKFINADKRIPEGTGDNAGIELQYIAAGNQLRWRPYGSSFWGTAVSLAAGGYFRLYSSSNDGYMWIDCYVDPIISGSGLPDHASVWCSIFHSPPVLLNSITTNMHVELWSSGEIATVDSIQPGVGYDDLVLKDPILGNYNVANTYKIFPKTIWNISYPGVDSFGGLSMDVDITKEIPALDYGTVVVNRPELPDNWYDASVSPHDVIITPETNINKSAIEIDDLSVNDANLEINIPFIDSQKGYNFILKVWVTNKSTLNTTETCYIGFDFGSGPILSGVNTITHNETIGVPKLLSFNSILPPNATQFKVLINISSNIIGSSLVVDKVILIQEVLESTFMGVGTVPRSDHRTNFGSLLYAWSSDELTDIERGILGIGSPVTDGLIKYSHNSHEQIDAFDVTDVVGADVVNVRGAVTDTEFSASTLTNLDIVTRSPNKYSYLVPIKTSHINDEQLIFSGGSPNLATLAYPSNMNMDEAILYENNIPVTQDNWSFYSETEIEILSGFNPSATYKFEYNLLTRLETAPISLISPPDNGNDTWYADYLIWNRQDVLIRSINETVSIYFNTAFVAVLPRESDTNKLKSVLIENNGINSRTVPYSAWDYVDNISIRIEGSEFNPDSLYSFQYNQLLSDPERIINVISEIRSGDSLITLAAATYREFNINNIIDTSSGLVYHQIRLTFDNITNLEDLRVHSAVLKGLNMYGAGSPPPGM